MKNKKLLKISALLVSAFMLVGCGESPDDPKPGPDKTYYTVKFMDGENVFDTKQAEANDVVERPATDPQKDGFEFQGWYTAPTEGTKWNFATDVVKSNMNLYAQYLANQVDYTVNLYVGSELKDTVTTDSRSQADVTLRAVAVEEGKSLLGYAKAAGKSSAADIDYRVGAKMAYADVVALADENHTVNLYAVVKEGDIVKLNIGVWSRYISEEDFNTYYDAFKEYIKTVNIAYDFLEYTYFAPAAAKGDAYYGVAEFSKACKDDTSITIAFPSGANFYSQDSFKGVELAVNEQYGNGNVFGQTGRWITRWGTDDLSKAFTDWALTEAAIKICDPDYVTPPDYPVEEASDTKLVIGVWGRFLTNDHATAVLDAWKEYAKTEKIAYDEAKIEYYAGQKGETYNAKAKYAEAIGGNPAIDIILPIKLDQLDGTDVDFSKLSVKSVLNLGTGDEGLGLTIDGNSDRALATLNEDTLTASFVNFVKTEAGMKALDPNHGEEPEPVDAQTNLVISFYGKFISKDDADSIVSAVKDYFDAEHIAYTTVTPDYVSAEKGTNNKNYAANMSADANVSLYGASAAKTEINKVKPVVAQGDLATHAGETNIRVYFTFDTGALTTACITYLTSTAGQALLVSLTGE